MNQKLIIAKRIYALVNKKIDYSKPLNSSGTLADDRYQYDEIPDEDMESTKVPLEQRQAIIIYNGDIEEDEMRSFEEKKRYLSQHFYVLDEEDCRRLGILSDYIAMNSNITRDSEECDLSKQCNMVVDIESPITICLGDCIDLEDYVHTNISDYNLVFVDDCGNTSSVGEVCPEKDTTYYISVIPNSDKYPQCSSFVGEIDIVVQGHPLVSLSGSVEMLNVGNSATFRATVVVDGHNIENPDGYWSSSNTDAVLINKNTGKVYAVDEGESEITYTYVSEGGCDMSISTTLSITNCVPTFRVIDECKKVCYGGSLDISELVVWASIDDYVVHMVDENDNEMPNIMDIDFDDTRIFHVYIVDPNSGCVSVKKAVSICPSRTQDFDIEIEISPCLNPPNRDTWNWDNETERFYKICTITKMGCECPEGYEEDESGTTCSTKIFYCDEDGNIINPTGECPNECDAYGAPKISLNESVEEAVSEQGYYRLCQINSIDGLDDFIGDRCDIEYIRYMAGWDGEELVSADSKDDLHMAISPLNSYDYLSNHFRHGDFVIEAVNWRCGTSSQVSFPLNFTDDLEVEQIAKDLSDDITSQIQDIELVPGSEYRIEVGNYLDIGKATDMTLVVSNIKTSSNINVEYDDEGQALIVSVLDSGYDIVIVFDIVVSDSVRDCTPFKAIYDGQYYDGGYYQTEDGALPECCTADGVYNFIAYSNMVYETPQLMGACCYAHTVRAERKTEFAVQKFDPGASNYNPTFMDWIFSNYGDDEGVTETSITKKAAAKITELKDYIGGKDCYNNDGCEDYEDLTSLEELKYFTSLTSIEYSDPANSDSDICGGWEDFGNKRGYAQRCPKLKSIVIPDSVTSIGTGAFSTDVSLSNVVLSKNLEIIGDGAFINNESLSSITLPNSLKTIGQYAFSGSGLTGLIIPDSVEYIGEGAFECCNEFDNAKIEFSNCVCDDYIFSNCRGIVGISVSGINYGQKVEGENIEILQRGAIPPHFCYNCHDIVSVDVGQDIEMIENNSFSHCENLRKVLFQDGVTSIGGSAFFNCSSLEEINLGSVTSIGYSAFSNCSSLEEINLNSVTSIGDRAFYGCSRLTSVTIPNSVTSIGYETFYDCIGLTSVTIGNGVTSIGDYAFYGCTGLTSVIIPNSVTSIGSHAFQGCTGLTSVEIPNSVTSIGDEAFSDCTGLTSINVAENNLNYASIDGVLYSKDKDTLIMCPQEKTGIFTIPNSVTSIRYDAFYGCTGLTSITIPNSVTSIREEAFCGCTGLTSITIPNSVTSIGEDVFYGCSRLASINVAENNLNYASIDGVLYSKDRETLIKCPEGKTGSITIPNSMISIKGRAFYGCTGLTSINVAEDNLHFASIDGVLYSKYKNTLIMCPKGKTGIFTIPNSVTRIGGEAFYKCIGLTSVAIPNSVTSIGYRAFKDCTGLTSITIPNSVTSIEEDVFYGCTGLTNVTIGNGVTSIGSYAFYGCTKLTSVAIPNSVTSIGYRAFKDCTGLTSITIGNSVTSIRGVFDGCIALTSVTIPNSVTSIGEYAFYGCTGLTSVTILNSVTSIGEYAFYGCTGLTSVTIPNGVTKIGKYAFFECERLTSVTIPNSVAYIEEYTFDGCTGLTSVTIPNSVTSIGEWAFHGCSGLTSITIPNSVTSIGDFAFDDCSNLTTVHLKCNKFIYANKNYSIPFGDVSDTPKINLYVPDDLVDSYSQNNYWRQRCNIPINPIS